MKLLITLYENVKGLPSMFIDGIIVVGAAGSVYLEGAFSSDEAKYLFSLLTIFISKHFFGCLAGMLIALQGFRSKSFQDYLDNKQKKAQNDQTQQFTKL